MITAVDTSVLLDIFADDVEFRDRSLSAVRRSLGDGQLVACDVVWSEVVTAFPDVPSAHPLEHTDRLLTRDRGFQRAAFAGLTIFDPTQT